MLVCRERRLAVMSSRMRALLVLAALLVVTVLTVGPLPVKAQTYSVSFTVVGLPSGIMTNYYVDGSVNGTIQTGDIKTLEFLPGRPHTVSVDLRVSGGNGTRYECRDNLWSFSDAGIPHTFTYKTQYYLDVMSQYGSPSGTGWYDEGTTAYAKLAVNMTEVSEGVRYVFARWEADASGQNIVSDPIVMDHPKKAVAVWKTQYTLRISSDPVDIFSPSTLWFDAGALASLSAPNGTALANTRFVFTQWGGDYAGLSPQGSLKMDGPKSIVAKYRTQYLLSIKFTPPEIEQQPDMPRSEWHDAGSSVPLGPVPQTLPVSSVERLTFDSWKLDGMTQQGLSMDVSMDGPHQVGVTYQTEYFLEVTSTIGETIGSGWYPSGETATFGVTYHGSDFPVKYSLTDWQSNPSTTITKLSATEAKIKMDRAYAVKAVWTSDYTPALIFLFVIGSVVILIAGFAFLAVKRPGSLGRLMSSFRRGPERGKLVPPGPAAAVPSPLVVCQKCGARVPESAGYCQSCGASLARVRLAESAELEVVDERVYEYILKRQGEISLSQASRDLRLSVDELKNSTERLKKKGRLE